MTAPNAGNLIDAAEILQSTTKRVARVAHAMKGRQPLQDPDFDPRLEDAELALALSDINEALKTIRGARVALAREVKRRDATED